MSKSTKNNRNKEQNYGNDAPSIEHMNSFECLYVQQTKSTEIMEDDDQEYPNAAIENSDLVLDHLRSKRLILTRSRGHKYTRSVDEDFPDEDSLVQVLNEPLDDAEMNNYNARADDDADLQYSSADEADGNDQCRPENTQPQVIEDINDDEDDDIMERDLVQEQRSTKQTSHDDDQYYYATNENVADSYASESPMSIAVHCISSREDYENISCNMDYTPVQAEEPEDVTVHDPSNSAIISKSRSVDVDHPEQRSETFDAIVRPPPIDENHVQVADVQNRSSSNHEHVVENSNVDLSTDIDTSYYEEDFETELTWRLDPSISLSDWVIEVIVTDQRGLRIPDVSTIKYPVHKSVLAVGPRRSTYFANEFKRHAADKKAAAAAEKARALMLLEQLERQREQQREATNLLMDNEGPDLLFDLDDNPFARLAAAGCNFIGAPLGLIQSEKPKETTTTSCIPRQSSNGKPQNPIKEEKRPATPPMKQIAIIPNLSKLELQELAAVALPFMLDFIYSSSGKLEITTDRATALFFLSKKLEIKSLQYKVEQFWKGDLTIDTVLVYYQHARAFNENCIIAAAELLCAQHLLDLNDDVVVDLLATVDATFMYNVVTIVAREERARYASYPHSSADLGSNEELHKFYMQLSLLITVYCNIHRQSLSPDMFWKLTSERHLPVLEAKAAKALLDIQDAIVGPNYELTSLTSRCVGVLADHWDDAISVSFERLAITHNDITPRHYEEKDDSEYIPGRTKDLDRSPRTSSPETYVALPKLTGDAMEEFISLSLQNAKHQINRLEKENTSYARQNDTLRKEIEILRLQLLHQDLNPLFPLHSAKSSIGQEYDHVIGPAPKSPVNNKVSYLPRKTVYSPVRRSSKLANTK